MTQMEVELNICQLHLHWALKVRGGLPVSNKLCEYKAKTDQSVFVQLYYICWKTSDWLATHT